MHTLPGSSCWLSTYKVSHYTVPQPYKEQTTYFNKYVSALAHTTSLRYSLCSVVCDCVSCFVCISYNVYSSYFFTHTLILPAVHVLHTAARALALTHLLVPRSLPLASCPRRAHGARSGTPQEVPCVGRLQCPARQGVGPNDKSGR